MISKAFADDTRINLLNNAKLCTPYTGVLIENQHQHCTQYTLWETTSNLTKNRVIFQQLRNSNRFIVLLYLPLLFNNVYNFIFSVWNVSYHWFHVLNDIHQQGKSLHYLNLYFVFTGLFFCIFSLVEIQITCRNESHRNFRAHSYGHSICWR